MLRRKPEAIILAHKMDQSRKELYVEGQHDRLVISWLVKGSLPQSTLVREIDFVELPGEVPGGNKGRLYQFAQWVGTSDVRIRMFADADCDRLLGRPVPERVWLTDHRDLEGYVLCEKCLEKVLLLGLGTDRLSASHLVALAREYGRKLGLIRLMSEIDSLNLPFQRTDLRRHLKTDGHAVIFDLQGYLRALLQNAGISLARLAQIEARLEEVSQIYLATSDNEIIHGKDALCVIEAALADHEISPGDASRLLWSSFESSLIEEGSALEAVLIFLKSN